MSKYLRDGDRISADTLGNTFRTLGRDELARAYGLTLSDGGGLNVNVSSGAMLYQGVLTVSDSIMSLSVPASGTAYIFFDKDGNLSSNNKILFPQDSIMLGHVVAGASSITSVSAPVATNPADRKRILKTKRFLDLRSDPTPDIDPDFSFEAQAGDVWNLIYTIRASANTASDFILDLDLAAGQEATYSFMGASAGNNKDGQHAHGTPPSQIDVNIVGGTDHIFYFRALVLFKTSQTVNLVWGPKQASSAGIFPGSYLVAERIF